MWINTKGHEGSLHAESLNIYNFSYYFICFWFLQLILRYHPCLAQKVAEYLPQTDVPLQEVYFPPHSMETSLWWSKMQPFCCLRHGKWKNTQKSKPSFGAEEHPHPHRRNPGLSAAWLRHLRSALTVGAIQAGASPHQLAMQPGKSLTWPCNWKVISPTTDSLGQQSP